MKKLLHHPFIIRLLHWEYWDRRIVYAPLYPYWAWLSIRARSLYFLTAANPTIRNGGFIMESKKDVYDLLPQAYYPATLYFDAGTPLATVLAGMRDKQITFPLIAKPDIGERGMAVKKIEHQEDLEDYVGNMPVPFLIQEFVGYDNEVGIFFCKPPGSEGFLSGIVNKEPVTVTGDGLSTIEQLVKSNKRYLLHWQQIKALNSDKLTSVLGNGETLVLIPYGNHCRGSKFTDESGRITQKLSDSLVAICNHIPGFYYGRLDVRFKDWESLEQGKNLSIIEVNGSGSEPTHIYDPGHSIFFAWREIARHWRILYEISKENNNRGVQYLSLNKGRKEMNEFKNMEALLMARTW